MPQLKIYISPHRVHPHHDQQVNRVYFLRFFCALSCAALADANCSFSKYARLFLARWCEPNRFFANLSAFLGLPARSSSRIRFSYGAHPTVSRITDTTNLRPGRGNFCLRLCVFCFIREKARFMRRGFLCPEVRKVPAYLPILVVG